MWFWLSSAKGYLFLRIFKIFSSDVSRIILKGFILGVYNAIYYSKQHVAITNKLVSPVTGQNITFENRQTFDSTRHTRHTLKDVGGLVC